MRDSRRTCSMKSFDHSPFVAHYEVTRACDLVCRHCRSCAQTEPHPNELSTADALALIEDLARFPNPPALVLTGGDPMKRADLLELIAAASDRGLEVGLTPSCTPLVTLKALRNLRESGVRWIGLGLDGAVPEAHDGLRGVPGSYDLTLTILQEARALGLCAQVNTLITRRNADQLEQLAWTLSRYGIDLWLVTFLVPIGRGRVEQPLEAAEMETVFDRLWHLGQKMPYPIRTAEAPHFYRFLLQKGGRTMPQPGAWRRSCPGVAPGLNSGRGHLFISHTGGIFPDSWMPTLCGRFPQCSVVDVYRRHPLFLALRDADQLKGRCGVCEFRDFCGGSRARAYAVTRDPLAAEPDCAYVPAAWKERETCSA